MHIAILEDELTLAEEVKACLEQSEHTARIFSNGEDLIKYAARDTFDMFVLDWKVPKKNGFEVLKYLRETLRRTEPIIFLTSTDNEESIIAALSAGADDYCVKPVKLREFSARVNALHRRSFISATNTNDNKVIAGFTFQIASNTIQTPIGSVVLTEKEFCLAQRLFENLDRPIARTRLLLDVWGKNDDEISRTLDVHIAWIRKKLNIGAGSKTVRLTAIYGYGYRLMQMLPEDAQ
jgi:DNA-binding response OmpR family regulator